MLVAMKFVTKHGDGRLIFKRDIPIELRGVAKKTTWQRALGAREWNSKVAARYDRFLIESDRAFAKWRSGKATPQSPEPLDSNIRIIMPGDPDFDLQRFLIERHNPVAAMRQQLVEAGVLPGRVTSDRAIVQLDAVVDRWARERNARPATVSDMKTALDVLKGACGARGLDEYDHADARKAKDAILAEPVQNGTKRKRWNMLSALFAFGKSNKLASVDIFADVRLDLEKDAAKRLVWDVAALNRLFATPVFSSQQRPRAGGGEFACGSLAEPTCSSRRSPATP